MRIGLSTLEVQPEGRRVQRYMGPLSRGLLGLSEAPELVVFAWEEEVSQYASSGAALQCIAVPPNLRNAEQLTNWYAQELPWMAEDLELDLLHLPDLNPLPGQYDFPLVATLPEKPPEKEVKTGWWNQLRERFVPQKSQLPHKHIIAPSRYATREFESRLGYKSEHFEIIPHGIDHETFHPVDAFEAKAEAAARFDLKEAYFLAVGKLDHPEANHLSLIAAFNRFRRRKKLPWQLVIVGEDGLEAEKIHAAIRQSPYASDICRLRELPPAELARLYQAAEVLVAPTLREKPDLTLVEAMACGCPVTCSARGGLGEVVGDATSLLNPDDVEDIVGKMAALAGSPELRQRWRMAGLKRAKNFDWQQAAIQTRALYERLIGY